MNSTLINVNQEQLTFLTDGYNSVGVLTPHWDLGSFVYDNHDLCDHLRIAHPSTEYQQNYADHKVRVKVY